MKKTLLFTVASLLLAGAARGQNAPTNATVTGDMTIDATGTTHSGNYS